MDNNCLRPPWLLEKLPCGAFTGHVQRPSLYLVPRFSSSFGRYLLLILCFLFCLVLVFLYFYVNDVVFKMLCFFILYSKGGCVHF